VVEGVDLLSHYNITIVVGSNPIFSVNFNGILFIKLLYYNMVSIYTLHQLPRTKRKKKIRTKALKGCPQRRGVCVRLAIMPPRKPNSARRKAARVRVSTKKEVFAYIPGIGHNLLKFSHVLLRGGNRPDLPGVHYTMIRGAKDLHGIRERTSARSKYGTKMWRSVKKKTRVSAIAAFKKKIIESGEFSYNKYDRQYEKFRQNRRIFLFAWWAYVFARRRRFLRKLTSIYDRTINKGKPKKKKVILPKANVSRNVSKITLPEIISFSPTANSRTKSKWKVFSVKSLCRKYPKKRGLFKAFLLRKKKKKAVLAAYRKFYPTMAKAKGLSTMSSFKNFKSEMSAQRFKVFSLRFILPQQKKKQGLKALEISKEEKKKNGFEAPDISKN
jgi:small subunit ribosomal protein S12